MHYSEYSHSSAEFFLMRTRSFNDKEAKKMGRKIYKEKILWF